MINHLYLRNHHDISYFDSQQHIFRSFNAKNVLSHITKMSFTI